MKKLFIILLAALFNLSAGFAQYNYLGAYTSDGTPLYLDSNDVVTNETLTLVQNALPEGYPVPTYNPQYISSGYDTDIILTDSASVWVTFINEGAGYKNVLGFYSYRLDSPYTTTPPSSAITIIFPNVSKLNSGGSLVAGNKVKLGNFSANTGIGFILIADGWRNGAVSNGNWKVYSNPNFNPESNVNLRFHNALIADTTNQRIILGFEDIRRDYGSCDNDFNDALFYISANPYTAIQTSNYAPIESANTAVTSGNSGGLESSGKLAQKIARRYFERQKNNTSKNAEKQHQKKMQLALSRPPGTPGLSGPLSHYFPTTGMFGNEDPYISTPVDLLNITNATEVFSADYYVDEQRVAVGLATRTNETVYSHTKAICDRLNSSSLEDVRTILLNGHKLTNTTLKKSNGEIEYTISFSVKVTDTNYLLYSYWNVEQYPAGEYLNFQAWGSSMGEVCALASSMLTKLELEKPVLSNNDNTNIPKVFVKKGYYKNGKLYLTICNKPKITSILFNGNKTGTETSSATSFSQTVALNGNLYQDIEVSTGSLFDIGFSITYPGCLQQDGLYLADGAWGADYDAQQVSDVQFTVTDDAGLTTGDKLTIERNPEMSGKVKGIVNLFRNAKAGNLPLDISDYKQFSFDMESSHPVEVILVSNDLTDWSQRARYIIPATAQTKNISIPLSKFTDNNGQPVTLDKIKTIVFSIAGNGSTYTAFRIKTGNANFNNADPIKEGIGTATVYPNPVTQSANISLPASVKNVTLQVSDVSGKIVLTENVSVYNGECAINTKKLLSGNYFFVIVDNEGKKYKGRFMVKK
jgi:hypothetical protein